ncbi:MAG: LamG domain-containing protein, partial [Candidatus Peribacteraceae bacterium]|nr:LamG domain-containing protein [Candidatus Peribacteraceae bacterium]
MTLLLFLLSLQPGTALAATRTWDGGGSTNNWSEDANWSDDTEPTAADTALFDATDATDVTVDSDILIGGLTVTSGYGGTLNLGSATITGSVGDGAVQFTAADKSWLTIADASQTGLDPGTSDFSISVWVYITSFIDGDTIIQKGATSTSGGNSAGYWLRTNTAGKLTLYFGDGTGNRLSGASSDGALSTGTWTHLSLNFDRDGNATLQLNGGAAAISFDISSEQGSVNSSDAFRLGSFYGLDAYFLNGKIDSLSFSNRLLTADEIAWLYNSGNGRVYKDIGIAGTNGSALKTSLVSWWDLGENAGTRYDSYGTNHLSQTFANIIAPPVYGSEKLTNGGFETYSGSQDDGVSDTFTGWSTHAAGGNTEEATATVNGGSNALKIVFSDGPSGTPYISQTVTVS